MELALYDPEFGYYARADQRSGRAGDFFTSVDVGAIFGELLEVQIAEMAHLLNSQVTSHNLQSTSFDLVEAGAGNGRLSADILRAARERDRPLYDRLRLHLVERSPAARLAQRAVLADTAGRLHASSDSLPESFEGVLVANELLDAMPVHQVVMREEGLRETYVAAPAMAGGHDGRDGGGAVPVVTTLEGPPSTPALAGYLARAGVSLEPGWRAEINLGALDWIRDVSRRLARGFVILIDYGHEARELYSATHSAGTLATFTRHTTAGHAPSGATPPWLATPGEQDITAHVDFTSVREAAEAEGLETLGFLDQTYFLMGLISTNTVSLSDARQRRAFKTLLMPGGLGSTMKVLILGKGVGRPALAGCSYRVRVT